MADLCDQASALEQTLRDKGIEAARAANIGEKPLSDDCIDCGDQIPEARRKAKPTAKRCIDCQTYHERNFA